MNQKLLAIAAIVTAAALTGIFSTTPMAAYASDGDSSETNTDQDLKQKNTELVIQPTSTVART
jgi:hypothetical protein